MEAEVKKLGLDGIDAYERITSDDTLYLITADYLTEKEENQRNSLLADDADRQKLYAHYAEILEEIKPPSDPSNAYRMLEKDAGKSPEYLLLSQTIASLVRAIGIDDPQDIRISDVVGLVFDMFTALRKYRDEQNVSNKIRRRVKAAVIANRQRNKELASGNLTDHLKDLYSLYPQVKELALNQWSSSAERPYRDTVQDIVQAIGIKDANDVRIAHAVTLTMDQYSVLRNQVTNHNLRKQFLSRIKKALSKEKLKRDTTTTVQAIVSSKRPRTSPPVPSNCTANLTASESHPRLEVFLSHCINDDPENEFPNHFTADLEGVKSDSCF